MYKFTIVTLLFGEQKCAYTRTYKLPTISTLICNTDHHNIRLRRRIFALNTSGSLLTTSAADGQIEERQLSLEEQTMNKAKR